MPGRGERERDENPTSGELKGMVVAYSFVKTEHFTGRSTHAYFSRCAPCCTVVSCSRFIQCTCIASRLDSSQHVSPVLKNIALVPQSFLQHVSCRNLLGLPERSSTFPDGLETESGVPCIDPRDGGSFGRMAEQSPLTGDEPKNLIAISSQHTQINFRSRRNSFHASFQRRAHHCCV